MTVEHFSILSSGLDECANDILAYIYDNKLKTFTIDITVTKANLFNKPIENVKEIKELMHSIISIKNKSILFNDIITFNSTPDIFHHHFFNLDYTSFAYFLYESYEILNESDNIIEIYSNENILDELERYIDEILTEIINIKNKQFKIDFSTEDKSGDIYDKLLNNFIDTYKLQYNMTSIKEKIIPKLKAIQKEMLNKN